MWFLRLVNAVPRSFGGIWCFCDGRGWLVAGFLCRSVLALPKGLQCAVYDQARSLTKLLVRWCHHTRVRLHRRQGTDGDHGELLRHDGIFETLVVALVTC